MDKMIARQNQRELDIATASEARAIVLHLIVNSIKTSGKDSSATHELEKKFEEYTKILSEVRAGDRTAINTTRNILRKFIKDNNPRVILKDTHSGTNIQFRPQR